MCAVYGGSSKWEQTQDLQQGAEIVVATPVSFDLLFPLVAMVMIKGSFD